MVLIVALRIAADRSAIIPRKHMVLFSIMFVLIAMGITTNTGNPVQFSLVAQVLQVRNNVPVTHSLPLL